MVGSGFGAADEREGELQLISASISALLTNQPRQMKAETLDALCTTLECTPGDLWVHTPPSRTKGA